MQIVLLQTYKGKSEGSLMEVSKEVGNKLVADGVARQAQSRDFLVKPKFGVPVRTSAFRKAPKTK